MRRRGSWRARPAFCLACTSRCLPLFDTQKWSFQRLVSDSIQEATAKASRNKMFEQFEGDPPLREQVFAQLAGVEKQLGVLGPEDWLTVNVADAHALGLSKRFVKSRSDLVELLQDKYPTHNFAPMLSNSGARLSQQHRLERAVKSLFPDVEVIFNARKATGLVNPATNRSLELDIFIPSFDLAFECQERHHYLKDTSYTDNSLEVIQERDLLKQELTSKKGITLITVPCWWDTRLESLAATIKHHRPELAFHMTAVGAGTVISGSPPPNFFRKHVTEIKDIGEPVTACFFTNVRQNDPTNWWIFEKYDGIRGFWNPMKKTMFSRSGAEFDLPQQVIDDMPQDLFLDGELWFGRDTFQESMKIAHRIGHSKIDWGAFRFMVFDNPTAQGSYSQRYQQLRSHLESKPHRFIRLAPYQVCEGPDHMEKVFQDIMDGGGEGIILRDPECPYQAGRSRGYLKHKKYRDAEARIIGPHPSIAGTWMCELANGVRFEASALIAEFARRWNPQPGDIVSFKHRGFTFASNKPKIPTLYRLRTDLSWDDVVANWDKRDTIQHKQKRSRIRDKAFVINWEEGSGVRDFLCKFAKDVGFDPEEPSNWEQVSRKQMEDHGGRKLFSRYACLYDILVSAYPEVNWEKMRPGYVSPNSGVSIYTK